MLPLNRSRVYSFAGCFGAGFLLIRSPSSRHTEFLTCPRYILNSKPHSSLRKHPNPKPLTSASGFYGALPALESKPQSPSCLIRNPQLRQAMAELANSSDPFVGATIFQPPGKPKKSSSELRLLCRVRGTCASLCVQRCPSFQSRDGGRSRECWHVGHRLIPCHWVSGFTELPTSNPSDCQPQAPKPHSRASQTHLSRLEHENAYPS